VDRLGPSPRNIPDKEEMAKICEMMRDLVFRGEAKVFTWLYESRNPIPKRIHAVCAIFKNVGTCQEVMKRAKKKKKKREKDLMIVNHDFKADERIYG
jgi:hypothetical protein